MSEQTTRVPGASAKFVFPDADAPMSEVTRRFEESMKNATAALDSVAKALEVRDTAGACQALGTMAKCLGWLKPAKLKQRSLDLVCTLSRSADDCWPLLAEVKNDLRDLNEAFYREIVSREAKAFAPRE